MTRLRLRHWLAVLLVAILAHGVVLADWHFDTAPPGGMGSTGSGGSTGIKIALAPARAQAAEQPHEQQPKPESKSAPESESKPAPEPEPAQPTPTSTNASRPDTDLPDTAVPQAQDDTQQAESAPSPEPQPKPEPQPEPEPTPEPKPQPEPEPAPKPEPEPQPEPEPRPEPAAQPEPTAEPEFEPLAAPTSRNDASSHDGSAAPQTTGTQSAGGGNGGVPASTGTVADTPPSYRQKLRAWLVKHKEYPRRARRLRMEGTVVLYFVMARDGRVLDWQIRSSSGHELLDQAVVQLIKSANPMPALPPEVDMQRLALTVPIRFQLQ